MLIVISAKFKNMQIRMQISQLILIFLQILFSKYFRYINSEFVYIFSFFVCWFIWKCQGLQFCKKVCKLDIIGTCKFDFKGIFGFGMMKSVYQSMITVKIVIFSNFYHFRSPPNVHHEQLRTLLPHPLESGVNPPLWGRISLIFWLHILHLR